MFNKFFCDGYDDVYMPVSENDINRIERELNIALPDVLRKYYLEHNGKYIKLVKIKKDNNGDDGMGDTADIAQMLPLTSDDEFNVECIKKNELNEPNDEWVGHLRIRTNFIPLAINGGGDIYYWDSNDGKVYISFNACEDENGMEIPYYVCSSVDKMFRLMNEAYEKGR